jgi:hypothetical protein
MKPGGDKPILEDGGEACRAREPLSPMMVKGVNRMFHHIAEEQTSITETAMARKE